MNENDNVIKGGKFAVVLASALLFYKIRPYFFWSEIFLDNYFNAIISIIIGFFFFLNRKNTSVLEKCLMALLGIIIAIYPIVGDQNFNVFISILPILFIPFATGEFNKKVYNCFLNIYCLLIGISLIVWGFSLAGVISPLRTIQPLNEIKGYGYYVYPFLVRETNGWLRFCGLFDEPGVVGTMSGLFLCCQKNFRNSKSIILLISGFCSLSLFFYIIVAIYFTYTKLIEQRNFKSIIGFVTIAIIAILIISSSPILSEMILSRLEYDSSSGTIAGDNRNSDYAIDVFNSMIGTRELWFGIDNKWDFFEYVKYSSSFLNVIIMNGVVFTSLIFLFYLAYGLIYKSSIFSFMMYLFVVVGTLYQRPGIFHPEFIFLFIFLAQKDYLYNEVSKYQTYSPHEANNSIEPNNI